MTDSNKQPYDHYVDKYDLKTPRDHSKTSKLRQMIQNIGGATWTQFVGTALVGVVLFNAFANNKGIFSHKPGDAIGTDVHKIIPAKIETPAPDTPLEKSKSAQPVIY